MASSYAATSEQIASLLGLKDGSFVRLVPLYVQYCQWPGTAMPPFGAQVSELITDFTRLTAPFLNPRDLKVIPLVMTPLAANYLPVLARAVALHPPSLVVGNPWFQILQQIGCNNPQLTFFMRTHEDSHLLLLRLFEAVAATVPPKSSLEKFDRLADTWTSLLWVVQGCFFDLFPSSAPSPPYPWSSSSTSSLLPIFKRTATMLDQINRARAFPISSDHRASLEDASKLLSMLEEALSIGFDTPGGASMVYSYRGSRPSTRCEYSISDECPKRLDYENMAACSRCRTIRYCCQGDQKADWKRHKPLCMPATWTS